MLLLIYYSLQFYYLPWPGILQRDWSTLAMPMQFWDNWCWVQLQHMCWQSLQLPLLHMYVFLQCHFISNLCLLSHSYSFKIVETTLVTILENAIKLDYVSATLSCTTLQQIASRVFLGSLIFLFAIVSLQFLYFNLIFTFTNSMQLQQPRIMWRRWSLYMFLWHHRREYKLQHLLTRPLQLPRMHLYVITLLSWFIYLFICFRLQWRFLWQQWNMHWSWIVWVFSGDS